MSLEKTKIENVYRKERFFMLIVHQKTPVDNLEFNSGCYCPFKELKTGDGALIYRLNEYEIIVGFLDYNFMNEQPTNHIFNPLTPGFIWTCPDRLKTQFQNLNITVEKIVKDWEFFQESTGLLPSNFQSLDKADLIELFPRDQLKARKLSKTFMDESTPLKEINLQQSILFRDSYEATWLLNRLNISTICIFQVIFNPSSNDLTLETDAIILSELSLSFFDNFATKVEDWNCLTLKEILKLKNLMIELKTNATSPIPKSILRTIPKEAVRETINPTNHHEISIF